MSAAVGHDPLEPLADDGVVVGDQDPDHRADPSVSDRDRSREPIVPRPGRPATSIAPPSRTHALPHPHDARTIAASDACSGVMPFPSSLHGHLHHAPDVA